MGKEAEVVMNSDLEAMDTKSTASTAVFCSSFFLLYFFLKTLWDCVWNLAVTILTHPLKFLSDRIWRLRQLNKKARDRALVRCPSPLSGSWPAQYNRERQMASDHFLFNFCTLTLFLDGSNFVLLTMFVILPCVLSLTCYSFGFFFEVRLPELHLVFEKQMHREFIQWQSHTFLS